MMPTLYFLHAAASHQHGFQALADQIHPGLSTRHALVDDLLDQARTAGTVTPDIEAALAEKLSGLEAQPTDLVLCTCSTLGGPAERQGLRLRIPVLRIDRPMADAAVMIGGTALVVACLQSTVPPTLALLEEAARLAHTTPLNLQTLLLPDAWALFEQGDMAGYAQAVASGVRQALAVRPASVVILAQASMAPAAALCADIRTPVLASPTLGVQQAISRLLR